MNNYFSSILYCIAVGEGENILNAHQSVISPHQFVEKEKIIKGVMKRKMMNY